MNKKLFSKKHLKKNRNQQKHDRYVYFLYDKKARGFGRVTLHLRKSNYYGRSVVVYDRSGVDT